MAHSNHERESTSVGRNVLRKEGREKLTGEAKYVDDLSYPGMLYGKTIRSTIPHGVIEKIEFDPAFDWTGITIADFQDIPGKNVVALIHDDQPLLVEREVRHAEEPILLLAANDREMVEEAAKHVLIEYKELPGVLSMHEALKGEIKLHGEDNIYKRVVISKGDAEKGFAEADVIVEGAYQVGPQEQLYIEPQGMIALPGDDGSIIVEGSMQCPYYVHRALKHLFGLPDEKVIVRQTVTGGGFGGKEEYPNMIAGHAALLACKSGKPVKIIYDRMEDLAATPKRHPAVIRHRSGVSKDGRLVAMAIDILMDGGAYCTLSPVVLSRAAIHATGPYRCPNVQIEAKVVATNNIPYGAFRGFGVPQVCFAAELQMDKIAATLGLEPLTIRQSNMLRLGDETATGQKLLHSAATEEVLNIAVSKSDYVRRYREYQCQIGTKRRGIGLSFFFHGAGFTGSGESLMNSEAGVEILSDGSARILTSSTEIGQGTQTIFCQIVSDELGIDYEQVVMEEPDTSLVPDSGPTVASRTCMIMGRVVQQAARELKDTLTKFVAGQLGVATSGVETNEGAFIVDGAPVMLWAEAARTYLELHGPLKISKRYESPPEIHWDDASYRGDAYPAYAFAADVAEVEVDMETCEISVLRITNASDVGRAIHPILAQGQIEGGTVQALGYATIEEVVMQSGRVVNNRLTNYLIPTSLDAPEIETFLVESEYPHGPFGAKGIGELPMDGAAPAIASAIWNATGVMVTELPITADRLLEAIEPARTQSK